MSRRAASLALVISCVLTTLSHGQDEDESRFAVLRANSFSRQIEHLNANEVDSRPLLVPNDAAWRWLRTRIPLFECSDAEVEEIYYYRWWALRKHVRLEGGRRVLTEFLTKDEPISSALGHQIVELRWLADPSLLEDYVLYWLRGHEGGPQPRLHNYSGWLSWALLEQARVTGDPAFALGLLDDLIRDDEGWDQERLGPSGLYWQYDVRDAMEESISGSRTARNLRPTINSYMYGNAVALSELGRLGGRSDVATRFEGKAAQLRRLTQTALWDPGAEFFKVRLEEGTWSDAREAIGFVPWYFSLPDPEGQHSVAWGQLTDPGGFWAPFGITTAERRHPRFRSHGVGTCEWDGAVWPFATSQTLGALARLLREYPPQSYVGRRDYFDAFMTYVRSQRLGERAYVGEYLDETTGQWLKGDHPRSREYNHSTFADLLISGIVGLRPQLGDQLEVDPFLAERTWRYFCLDGLPYHGRMLTILWDRDGERYGRGPGLQVLVDGRAVAHVDSLRLVSVALPAKPEPATDH